MAHVEEPSLAGIETVLSRWQGGADAGAEQLLHFDNRMIELSGLPDQARQPVGAA